MTVKGGTSQACAACKFQRRRCSSECVLAPYFPANNTKMFENAHRLFGVSKIMKILDQLDTKEQKDEAMKSVIFESDMRHRFPVTGCCGIISEYSRQYALALEELRHVCARLAMCREETSHHHHQIVDDDGQFPPSSELQLGINPIGNELLMLQNSMPLDDACQYVMMNAHDNVVYVDQSTNNDDDDDDMAKQWWIQNPNPNYSYHNNNDHLAAIQSQAIVRREAEVDYEDIPIDTSEDDRQSCVESKEACQSWQYSSCQSSWKVDAEHVSANELKNAAAGWFFCCDCDLSWLGSSCILCYASEGFKPPQSYLFWVLLGSYLEFESFLMLLLTISDGFLFLLLLMNFAFA